MSNCTKFSADSDLSLYANDRPPTAKKDFIIFQTTETLSNLEQFLTPKCVHYKRRIFSLKQQPALHMLATILNALSVDLRRVAKQKDTSYEKHVSYVMEDEHLHGEIETQ